MVRTKLFFISSAILMLAGLAFNGCEEVGPFIDFSDNTGSVSDTCYLAIAPTAQLKSVLIEEFTGLKCPNCPEGHQTSQQIADANPGRVIEVRIVNYFLDPHSSAIEDYQIAEGEQINQLIGPITAWPKAGIDRKLFSGQSDILLERQSWVTSTDEQLALTTPINIEIENTYNATDHTVEIKVTLQFSEEVTDQLFLSALLTESNIIDVQDDATGTITDYNHKHVLRDYVTSTTGVSLPQENGSYPSGWKCLRFFTATLESHWEATETEVVAFVHTDQTNKLVIHTNAEHVSQ